MKFQERAVFQNAHASSTCLFMLLLDMPFSLSGNGTKSAMPQRRMRASACM